MPVHSLASFISSIYCEKKNFFVKILYLYESENNDQHKYCIVILLNIIEQ